MNSFENVNENAVGLSEEPELKSVVDLKKKLS